MISKSAGPRGRVEVSSSVFGPKLSGVFFFDGFSGMFIGSRVFQGVSTLSKIF